MEVLPEVDWRYRCEMIVLKVEPLSASLLVLLH